MQSDQELQLTIKKTRFWMGVLYIENMVPNWKEDFEAIIQVPFCYVVHDKDLKTDGDADKPHVQLMFCFDGPTTQSHALAVVNQFSLPGKVCCPKRNCTPILNFRRSYDYLIHDTADAKRKNKFQYDKSDRVDGNNFDFGRLDQLSLVEQKDISKEISDIIAINKFTNFTDVYLYLRNNYDDTYYYVFNKDSAYFERLIKGNWQKSEERNYRDEKIVANLKKVLS